MNETVYHCTNCLRQCQLRPTYLPDLFTANPVRSLCCNAGVSVTTMAKLRLIIPPKP